MGTLVAGQMWTDLEARLQGKKKESHSPSSIAGCAVLWLKLFMYPVHPRGGASPATPRIFPHHLVDSRLDLARQR